MSHGGKKWRAKGSGKCQNGVFKPLVLCLLDNE